MKYTRLGRSGLDVSQVCLGCMGFGEASPGRQDWAIGEDDSREIIKRALDLGVNFFDTANAYSGGSSEEITGRALRDMADRDEVVIATTVLFGAGNTLCRTYDPDGERPLDEMIDATLDLTLGAWAT